MVTIEFTFISTLQHFIQHFNVTIWGQGLGLVTRGSITTTHTAFIALFFIPPIPPISPLRAEHPLERVTRTFYCRGLRLAEKTLSYRRTYTHCRSSHGPNRTRARRGVGLPPPNSCWIYLKIFCWSPALYTRKSPVFSAVVASTAENHDARRLVARAAAPKQHSHRGR